MEIVTDFIFLGSRITVDMTATMQLKDSCSFGRKAMTNLETTLKSRDITLLTKVCIVKVVVFLVVMHRCELDCKEG